jgi:FAD/FMN-containing dehydrogenase/Fe-S oxidoreductase
MGTVINATSGTAAAALPGGMDALVADLREATSGEVRFDAGSRAAYAYDASVYRQVPVGVVIPRALDEVPRIVDACRHHDVALLGRGCGTSLAGQCCNAAVVIDFSKYLHEIVELDPDRRTARVQPGVICDGLRAAAQRFGLTFAPDPATHDHATLGGMIGNNSCGTHSVMGGKTVDNIESLEVVTYDGTRMRVGLTSEEEVSRFIAAGGRRGEIYKGLRDIRDRYADLIRERYPRIPRRVSGYNLDQLLPENGFHVARALVGTESTCALVLEATCRLLPSPPKRTLVALGYPDIPSAGDAVPEIMGHAPIALEYFDRTVIEQLHAKGFHFGGQSLLPDGTGWLLVEFGAGTQEQADAAARQLVDALARRGGGPAAKVFDDPEEETAVWEARKHGVGSSKMPIGLGYHPGWPNWEDAAVAPDRLGDYLRDYLALLERYGYKTGFWGHFGQGCVHCRLDFDLRTAPGIAKFRSFMEDAADLVVSYGGSLSGEHGDGHGRAELLPKMFGPEIVRAFEEFKAVWDPAGKMNPGKIVNPYPLDTHLREGTGWQPVQVRTHFQFPEDGGSFAEAAGRCFGVGKCRHLEGGTMCPSFMVTREEEHSTRGRARLLYEMLRSEGPVAERWHNEDVKRALDLCLACKGCKGDCPVRVDMATYKAEFLSHYYEGRLRPRSAYAMGLIPVWARLGGRVPALANAVLHAPVVGAALKAAAGVDPARQVPRLSAEPFTEWFGRRQAGPRDGRRVLLFADTFTNYFDADVARAATDVLEAAGYDVAVTPERLCCGRPFYDYGMLDLAERYLRRVLNALRPVLEDGMPIVVLEPSCAAVFRDELLNLFPEDQDARRLAAQTVLFTELLQRTPAWAPAALGRRAVVQAHCHQKAVFGTDADKELLARLGVDATFPDSGCCGMAGSFGYERGEHHDVSMACAERVLLPAVRDATPDTLIVADGFSCREQIVQATGREVLHVAQVAALALGQRGTGSPEPGADRHRLRTAGVVTGAAVVAGLAAQRARRALDVAS